MSDRPIKLILCGDSGAGKTGALASLAADGYNLRVLDYDDGIPILEQYLTHPESQYVKKDPKCAERLDYVTLTDTMRNIGGLLVPKSAEAWSKGMKLLNDWKHDDVNLGPVTSWGPKDILVIDSLSRLSEAALNFCLSMDGGLGKSRTSNESRRDTYKTQNLLRTLLQMLFDTSIKCNVIMIAHITFVSETGNRPGSEEDKDTDAVINGYPAAIGRALSPHIPRYFNTVLIARPTGSGRAIKHKIYTTTTSVAGMLINAKNQAPLKVKYDYDLATGLAEFFKAVKS